MTITIPCPNCEQPLEVTLASTNYEKTKHLLAADITNEELNKRSWKQSQKLQALSTILANQTTLADPLLRLLFDRLVASTNKSLKLESTLYKLSQNQERTQSWLQRWQPIQAGR